MPCRLHVAYLLTLLAVTVSGFTWEAPTAVKALVGAAAMIPVSVAILVVERRKCTGPPAGSNG